MIAIFFTYYTYLSFIGFLLLMCRKDRQIIYEDLIGIALRNSLVMSAINLILLYLVMPITIPFSILNIIKK